MRPPPNKLTRAETARALERAELTEPADDPAEVRDAWIQVAVTRLERYEREGGPTYSTAEVLSMARKTIDGWRP